MKRRAYLVGVAGLSTAVAGCTTLFGDDESDRDVDPTTALNRIPNAAVSDDRELYITADAPAALVDVDDYALREAVGESVSGIEASRVDARAMIDPYRILVGSFDAADVTELLEVTRDGTVGSFDRVVEDDGTAHAVGEDEAILRTVGQSDDTISLESIADASDGSDRLLEHHSVVERLCDQISTDTHVEMSLTPSNDEWHGFGVGYEVDSEESTATLVMVLTDAGRGLEDDAVRDRFAFLFPGDLATDDIERNADLVTARTAIPTNDI
ncbi:hypothetical protein [Natronosalvus vescus]|uniref:hypothetical protein n=1 Tax=Natronosalvus vescus TaxID=2953881 RepID=UPI0020908F7B|nr:hypothetical protein [Natronosalvus vescus]